MNEPGKSRLSVSNRGNDVASHHFENSDNPEGWGSELCFEPTQ